MLSELLREASNITARPFPLHMLCRRHLSKQSDSLVICCDKIIIFDWHRFAQAVLVRLCRGAALVAGEDGIYLN